MQFSVHGIALGDSPPNNSQPGYVAWAGADKADVIAIDADLLLQFQSPDGTWLPEGGMRVLGGVHRSFPGLREVYTPGGPVAVRCWNYSAGVVATLDLDLWAPGG